MTGAFGAASVEGVAYAAADSPTSSDRPSRAFSPSPTSAELVDLIELGGAGLWSCGKDFTFSYVSTLTAALLGDLQPTGSDDRLTHFFRLIAPPLLGDLSAALAETVSTGHGTSLIVTGTGSDQNAAFFELVVRPTSRTPGESALLSGSLRRLSLAADGGRLLVRLLSALDVAETALALVRDDGCLAYANFRLLALAGKPSGELIGQALDSIIDPASDATGNGAGACRVFVADSLFVHCWMVSKPLPTGTGEPGLRLLAVAPYAETAKADKAARTVAQVAAGIGIEVLCLIAQLLEETSQTADQPALLRLLRRPAARFLPNVLTDRQRQIAREMLAGRTTREIAAGLGLSTETVRTHQKEVYRRLGVRGRHELLARFVD